MRYLRWERLRRFLGPALVLAAVALIVGLAVLQARLRALPTDRSTPAPTATALVGGVLLFSLATGAGSMAIVQLAKQVFGVRAFYQGYRTTQWLAIRSDGLGSRPYKELIKGLGYIGYDKGRRRNTLARSEERALFNLPIAQLAAQVSLVADLALSYPEDYQALLASLTGGYGDFEKRPSAGPPPPQPSPAFRVPGPWQRLNRPAARGAAAPVNEVTEQDIYLGHLVRGGVDALQLYVGQEWRRFVRISAVLISGILGVIWVSFLDIRPGLRVAYILSALVLGGFISWFLRDLVAIVERLRS